MAKTSFTEEQCRQFEEAANPHAWMMSADRLHGQAVALRTRFGHARLVLRGPATAPTQWDETGKANFLLCAVALENSIKAFLVYENPDWVANGNLHSEILNHKLATLAKKSALIPYLKRDMAVLDAFERGNESWMRYPCGRHANDLAIEPSFSDRLWLAYLRVMRGYGGKLRRLLENGWKGPHVFHGSWTMAGEWLGHVPAAKAG